MNNSNKKFPNKKINERIIKSKEKNTKENSMNKYLKKNYSFSRNNLIFNNNNKIIPPNTIIYYNKKRIKNHNYIKKLNTNLSERNISNDKKKEKSKTQRAKEYSKKVKEYNMWNLNNENNNVNLNKRFLSNNKSKNKIENFKNFNIKSNMIKDLSDLAKFLQRKKIHNYKNNSKSRNKKNEEGNKISTLTMNIKKFYTSQIYKNNSTKNSNNSYFNNNKDHSSNLYNKFYNIKNNEENKIQNFLKKN